MSDQTPLSLQEFNTLIEQVRPRVQYGTKPDTGEHVAVLAGAWETASGHPVKIVQGFGPTPAAAGEALIGTLRQLYEEKRLALPQTLFPVRDAPPSPARELSLVR